MKKYIIALIFFSVNCLAVTIDIPSPNRVDGDFLVTGDVTFQGDLTVAATSTLTTAIFGTSTDNTQIEPDGTLKFNGDATVWDDLRVPLVTTKLGGAKDPDYGAFIGGTKVYLFDASSNEEAFFNVQLPHSYKEGSDVDAHIHWAPTTTATGNVVWGIEYTWANMDGTFPATTTATGLSVLVGNDQYKHILTEIVEIDCTGKTISGMLAVRVFRDAADSTDDYAGDAAGLEVDFHFQIDTIGSRTEDAK